MTELSDTAFHAVCDYFWRVSGIRLAESKRALVLSRLQRLAMDAGFSHLDDFLGCLTRSELDEATEVAIVDRLTTNETYFFREADHFTHLRKHIQQRASRDEFRIWSAACSSGEEAYSVAMLLADEMGERPWRIWGTDLSTAVVATARQGLYAMERARHLPADYLKRFCLRGEGRYDGQLLVDRTLRQHVEFLQANLTQALPGELPMFDVIFLRNVLIYFEPPAKADIVRRVITRLKPDGVLYTGHAESLAGLSLPLRSSAPAIHHHV